MNSIFRTLSPAIASLACLGLVACSGAGDSVEAVAEEVADTTPDLAVTEIVWDDLMPEGEIERLEALYANFYEELEKNMMAGQQTLMEADRNADIQSLIAEGSAADTMEQIGTFNVVEDLDGMAIRLPGYVVPLDFDLDQEHTEFLLVPYFGACLHSPPPPPNQMLFVSAEPAAKIGSIYDPVWVEGTIKTGQFMSDLGDSAYELKLSKIEPYEY
jgi:hypothetical protein